MTLPRKVREQEELAERLMKEAYQPQSPAPLQVVSSNPQPAPEAKQGTAQPVDNSSEPAAAPTTQQSEQQAQQPETGDESWENRYKVLSGKYSAEVPRYAAELRELKAKLAAKEKEAEEAKKAVARQVLVKPEEIEEYGENFVDLVRRAAREELSSKDSELAALRQELDVVKQTSSKSVTVDFYSQLASKVPDWQIVNDDTNFHRWLAEPDELTGVERQQLLLNAQDDLDPNRVANFFLSFKRHTQQRAASAKQALESQVVPDTVASSEPPQARRYWTRTEIDRFYAAVRRGSISDADAQRLEADIQAAMIEGRIR